MYKKPSRRIYPGFLKGEKISGGEKPEVSGNTLLLEKGTSFLLESGGEFLLEKTKEEEV